MGRRTVAERDSDLIRERISSDQPSLSISDATRFRILITATTAPIQQPKIPPKPRFTFPDERALGVAQKPKTQHEVQSID